METMSESLAACAPYANSYKRYRKEGWSPNSCNWGRNHRLVSLRIPISGEKDKRVEHRIAGADVNPYLLCAAVLAGIHHGVNVFWRRVYGNLLQSKICGRRKLSYGSLRPRSRMVLKDCLKRQIKMVQNE